MAPKEDWQRAVYVRFDKTWKHLPLFRAFILGYFQQRANERAGERIAMICQELLENALKYGDMTSDVEIEILLVDRRLFEVRVSNDAIEARLNLLRKEVDRINQAEAEAAFLQSMERSSKMLPGMSMLGLSRVRFEGQVSLRIAQIGSKVMMAAQGRL